MKAILISTDRINLEISTETFDTEQEAHDAMLAQIFNQSDYKTVDELVDAANAGEAGYSFDEAWISHSTYDTIVWKIIPCK